MPSQPLAVQKPISLWNKPLKADFRALFKSLGNAAITAKSGEWAKTEARDPLSHSRDSAR